MRRLLFLVALLTPLAFGKKSHPLPPEVGSFVLAKHTFVDFGPPLDFYEIYIVGATGSGTSIERVTLTPPGGSCLQPAKVETAKAQVAESIPELLGRTNPCGISEKEIKRELKRCKKCLAFSGAHILMRVQCGAQSRNIRSNVLDKDMFDANAGTPEHTSWTMRLLDRLDKSVGPGVMNQPIFRTAEPQERVVQPSVTVTDISSGKFDALFLSAPDKPSELYRISQLPIPVPDVQVVLKPSLRPEVFAAPNYPPLARIANIDGSVSVSFVIDAEGNTSAIAILDGHPMLRPAALDAVRTWRYAKEAASQHLEATMIFKPNCQVPH